MANVKFENITFRYGQNTVLNNFSLEVESGKIVCLVGPSGCGKTTLVRSLLGLGKPETGTITVGERCLFDAKRRINVPAEKRNIGIVFQDYAVWPHMTVIENVSYPLKKQRRPKEEIHRRAMHALEQVHSAERKKKRLHKVSGIQCSEGSISWDRFVTLVDTAERTVLRNSALVANNVQSFDREGYAQEKAHHGR